jgi:hypothetical protein
MSSYRLTAILENSLVIAALLSEDDLTHFVTFELLHASHGGLRARKQVTSVSGILGDLDSPLGDPAISAFGRMISPAWVISRRRPWICLRACFSLPGPRFRLHTVGGPLISVAINGPGSKEPSRSFRWRESRWPWGDRARVEAGSGRGNRPRLCIGRILGAYIYARNRHS